jgi:Fibronectin type III domain.
MKRFMLAFATILLSFYTIQANESQYPAPNNLYASNIYYSDAILNWSASTLAQKWIVSYTSCGNSVFMQEETTQNHLQITGLVSGLVYNWKVQMIDTDGDTTSWSQTQTFQTLVDNSFCGVVSNLTIDAMNQNGITIQWAADSSQTQWQLVYGELGSNPENQGTRTTLSNYYYTIPASNVSMGDWYQIAVRAVCSEGYGAWSFINTRYIASAFDSLPLRHTFEDDDQNNTSLTTSFGFISGTINPWVIDTAFNATTPLEDYSYSMYISSNSGENNNYFHMSSSISYAYIDVFVPEDATSFYMDFKYLCGTTGLNNGLKIYLLPSQSALDIKQLPNSVYQIGNTIYNGNDSAFQSAHIELPAQYVGQVVRVAFVWINDTTGSGEGGAVVDDIYITARYCATPSALTHNYVTSSSALLSWNFAPNQDSFNIEYRPVNSTYWNEISGVTNNYLLTGLTQNTLYYFRVQANCQTEASFFSAVDTFKTLVTCPAPQNLRSPYYTNAAAIINWDNDTTVYKWIIEYGVNNGENTIYTKKEKYQNKDTLFFLLPNTYYNVRAKAISYQGDTSAYSSVFLVHTLCDVVQMYPFTDLIDTAIFTPALGFDTTYHCWEEKGDTLLSPPFSFATLVSAQLSFNWLLKDSLSSTSNVKLLVSINNAQSFYPLTTLNLTADTFASKTIDLSAFWGENVVRFAFVPLHPQSSATIFKVKDFAIQDVCQSPENINFSNISSSSAVVSWTPYPNNTGWRLSLINVATNDTSYFFVQNQPIEIDNLQPLHTYKVMIKSVCDLSTLEDSWAEATFSTTDISTCNAPTSLTCTHYTNTAKYDETVGCQWDAMSTENNYELQYKEKYAVNWNIITVSGVNHYNVRNLNITKIYQFRVRTICDATTMSEFSDTVELSLSSLDNVSETNQGITMYPMPVSKTLNIDFTYPNFGTTILVNQEGQTIKQWQTLPHSIDVSHLAKGVYYLRIKTPETLIQKKVIVN